MSNTHHIWQDATTYSRGQEDRTPTAWDYSTPDLRIWISKAHRHYPGEWVITCHAVHYDAAKMKIEKDASLEDAQAMAFRIIKNKLEQMLKSMDPQ